MKFTIKFLVFVFGLQLASMVNAETFRDCPDCPEMVAVPAGSFEMGVNGVSPNEKPVHHVTFAQTFAMGTTEVTQAQWLAVMGSNPSNFAACGDSCPVEMERRASNIAYRAKQNGNTPVLREAAINFAVAIVWI
jgi:formylglycine-generating enzyme required for sulfatase activity